MTEPQDYEAQEDVQEDWEGFTSTQTDIEDDSLHPAVLSRIEPKRVASKWPDRADGTAMALEWYFALEDKDGFEVKLLTSTATGKKSRARPVIDALVGKDRASEMLKSMLRKEALVGRQCLVMVSINDDGYPNVSSVLPPQTTNAPRRADVSPLPVPDTTPRPSEAPESLKERISPDDPLPF